MQQRFNFSIREKSGFGLEHFAAWYNNIELLEFLIYDGNNQVNLDRKNKEGVTPLMMASLGGFEDVVEILVGLVDINSQDVQGNTALHYAIIKRHISIANLLINRKDIIINKKNCNMQTPEELIFFGEQINQETRQKLINLFCDAKKINQKIKKQNIARDYIISTKEDLISQSDSSQNLRIKVSDFKFIQEIGSGTFGKVFLVQKLSSNMFYAMKILQKKNPQKLKYKRQVLTERNVLCSINHPFIGKLRYAFQTDNFLYLTMDYYPGGSLRDFIAREIRVKEQTAKYFAAELILAIEELHKQNIIFRDLKPENIMIDKDGHLKLIDFGLSKENVQHYDGGGKSFCGSLNYLSPEMVLKKGYGKAIDWYSLGVVIHELLTGIPYCYCNKDEGILFKIQFSKPDYPTYLSEVTIDFLDRLLEKNPKKRLGSNYGVMEIKQHPWFSSIVWKDVLNYQLKMPQPQISQINFSDTPKHYLFHQDTYQQFSQNKLNGWSFYGVRLLLDKEIIHVPFNNPVILEYSSTSSENCRYNGFDYEHAWFDYNHKVGAFQKAAFLSKPKNSKKNGTLKFIKFVNKQF